MFISYCHSGRLLMTMIFTTKQVSNNNGHYTEKKCDKYFASMHCIIYICISNGICEYSRQTRNLVGAHLGRTHINFTLFKPVVAGAFDTLTGWLVALLLYVVGIILVCIIS